MNKRAQSGVVTAILLVLISLAAVVIVWNVVRGVVEKGTTGTKTGVESMFVQLEIEDGSVKLDADNNKLQFSITRGSDDSKVTALNVNLIGEDTANPPQTFTRTYEIKDNLPGPFETKTYVLSNIGFMKEKIKLSVYAVGKQGKASATSAEFTESETQPVVKMEISAGGVGPENCQKGEEDTTDPECITSGDKKYHTQTITTDSNGCTEPVKTVSEECDCATCGCPDFTAQIIPCTIGILTTTYTDTTGCGRTKPNEKEYCAVEDSLVSYWKFEGNANDEKGANPGTLKGNAQIVDDGTRKVLSLDGVGDYVSINPDQSINMVQNQPMSISYWMKMSVSPTPGNFYATVMKYDFSESYGHLIKNDNGALKLLIYTDKSSNPKYVVTGYLIASDISNWVYVTQTYDGSKIYLYKNGKLFGQSVNGIQLTVDTHTLYIGANAPGTTYNFKGAIDDVMIYNKALTADEVKGIYCSQGGYPGDAVNCPAP